MRIVIDMQGAQTESRYRGIGRYTMSLVKAMVRNKGDHEIILALNGLLSDSIEPVRTAFDNLLPQDNIRVWYAPGPVMECQPGNKWRRNVAERIREAFLFSLQPDIILISSLFEGYIDDAVTSINAFTSQITTFVILFDLIPLMNPDLYLKPDPEYEQYYCRKIDHLTKADKFLCISESTAREAITNLSVSSDDVATISTGCDSVFKPMNIDEVKKQTLTDKYGVRQPFIFYTGSADNRKNLHRLIQAYLGLPDQLRKSYQLVLSGKISESKVAELNQQTSRSMRHYKDHLVFTGHVTDEELTMFYNLCEMLVFPSLHEGFGLPALEAMSCGAAVIGSNVTSIPEVIGYEDALFDPYDEHSIRNKIEQVLTDSVFCKKLAAHGLNRAGQFTWDKCAQRTIKAFEDYMKQNVLVKSETVSSKDRPKLAYVSPLPPERSGIADYSAELLPALSKYYDIEVVVNQNHVSDLWVQTELPIRDTNWMVNNAHSYDRILYHFGNSLFHQHMFDMIKAFPGIVVLHDFFLGNLLSYLEGNNIRQLIWTQELYGSHGYSAINQRFKHNLTAEAIIKYPCNIGVLNHARGVIVHSDYSRKLASQWYGDDCALNWKVIPLLRAPSKGYNRDTCRKELDIDMDDFVVCSFGVLGPLKLNHLILNAWLSSKLADNRKCILIFVGENHDREYGKQLLDVIRKSGHGNRICITGWLDVETFRRYLAAADMAVQLRTQSRGETSAAVLDCMNSSLPTIVNANGSIAELPTDAVWMMLDEFDDNQLIEAIETLWQNDSERETLGNRAKEVINSRHAPSVCAEQYYNAIECYYDREKASKPGLINSIASIDNYNPTNEELMAVAQSVAITLPTKQPAKQFLIDISATCRFDLKTGIQRVARALLINIITSPPEGFRVEPVYLSNEGGKWHYRYARSYTLGLLNCPQDALIDEPVEIQTGDVLLGVDISEQIKEASKAGLLTHYKNHGVKVLFVVFDLLPVTAPYFFPPGADVGHKAWLTAIAEGDGAICISHAVADDLRDWFNDNQSDQHRRPFKINWNHLGSDFEHSAPSCGLPKSSKHVLKNMTDRHTFLMVSTIEPRKGYLQTIKAFDMLWKQNIDVNLVIVGIEGWQGLPDNMRRTIPETINTIKEHPELGTRLLWLDGISDECLEKIYASATCLIVASEDEGFGLPLIEAARHNLPIIARDIPVFREVAGEHAYYFTDSKDPEGITDAVIKWLELYEQDKHPKSDKMPWLTWEESTQSLLKIILG